MKKVTAILLGAGARGNIYANLAKQSPDEFEILAFAEPVEAKREKFAKDYGIKPENAFVTWEDLLKLPKMADACIVATLDDMHTEPAVMALNKGYHVLLEKPMAETEEECRRIAEAAEKNNRILSVCHVLRYTPFYSKIKEIVDKGLLGKVLCMRQTENVGYWHQAHSFVRGNWNNSETTTPMILAKSCHDMDIMSWIIGSKCIKVSSFGSLTYFKEENAPEGSTKRCLDGCKVINECPFYAPDFYLGKINSEGNGFAGFITVDTSEEGIIKALEEGPYGRCVFRCDNNVVDHQVVNMEFENSAVATFVMTAFTNECKRTLKIMGTEGELEGDMSKNYIQYRRFIDKEPIKIITSLPGTDTVYKSHGGGDYFLIRDFVSSVRGDEDAQNKTSAKQSLQSHVMCFKAEQSRVQGRVIELE